MSEMAAFQKKNFEKPDETKSPPNARLDTLKMGDLTITRVTYKPGWKWSKDIKPIVGTSSCQMHHVAFCLSGRLAGVLDDGTRWESGPGDMIDVPPGHDGWVVGEEPAVLMEIGFPGISR